MPPDASHPPALAWQAAACLPFVLLLGTIATAPLFARTRRSWEKPRTQWCVALVLGAVGAGAHLLLHGAGHGLHDLGHAVVEYLAFVSMLGALYAASSGIHLTGAFAGFPTTNALLLGIGAVLASFIGTTGASMLLVRPLLRANADRRHKVHTFVFFIFIVSNCGGLLLPMGDPPLFLGFLRGVPFAWTLQHLWVEWLLVNGALLALYGFLDTRQFTREAMITRGRMLKAVAKVEVKLQVHGWRSVGLLVAVPAAMLACGSLLQPWLAGRIGEAPGMLAAQGAQVACFVLILVLGARFARRVDGHENPVDWHPVIEVAALFSGIFLAMVPSVALLHAVADRLPLDHPWQYFAATGSLSAVLDNAPTYAAIGELGAARAGGGGWADFAAGAPHLLAGIACGAVFCGAMTYIGNGPNFMVKSVCERHGVRMPSFFGYLGWSLAILLPVLALLALMRFR